MQPVTPLPQHPFHSHQHPNIIPLLLHRHLRQLETPRQNHLILALHTRSTLLPSKFLRYTWPQKLPIKYVGGCEASRYHMFGGLGQKGGVLGGGQWWHD
jgi:hypothetical protein